jgi:hypothetical protein
MFTINSAGEHAGKPAASDAISAAQCGVKGRLSSLVFAALTALKLRGTVTPAACVLPGVLFLPVRPTYPAALFGVPPAGPHRPGRVCRKS